MTKQVDEHFAVRVLSTVIGFELEQDDDGSVNAMADGVGKDRHGDSVALEVTRIGEQDQFESYSRMDRDGFRLGVEGGTTAWHATVGPGYRTNRYQENLVRVARLCERYVVEPDQLRHHESRAFGAHNDGDTSTFSQETDWYFRMQREEGLRMKPWPHGTPGTISISPVGTGGFVPTDAEPVVAWLDQVLASDHLINKASKLKQYEVRHRHLFLIIFDHGIPFPAMMALTDNESVPTTAPEVPAMLTDVWMYGIPNWVDKPILRWSRQSGWTRHRPDEG